MRGFFYIIIFSVYFILYDKITHVAPQERKLYTIINSVSSTRVRAHEMNNDNYLCDDSETSAKSVTDAFLEYFRISLRQNTNE